jgi:hypothetical protein
MDEPFELQGLLERQAPSLSSLLSFKQPLSQVLLLLLLLLFMLLLLSIVLA